MEGQRRKRVWGEDRKFGLDKSSVKVNETPVWNGRGARGEAQPADDPASHCLPDIAAGVRVWKEPRVLASLNG